MLENRRGVHETITGAPAPLATGEQRALEDLDLVYRTLCAILYNYVPLSGHPGGSISSGRIVAGLVFDGLDLDLGDPQRADADVLAYAAGHKAMGLYAMWALRNEVARVAAPSLLPSDPRMQLRLECLLGFRKNPTQKLPLAERLGARMLDGHPTPATPFVRMATGASGVGLASAIGYALAATDVYGVQASPRVHVIEGEGGLTTGRASEALAIAATAGLANVVVHLDWNQASIDSERVCRDGDVPGDYVQWSPAELFRLHDWNVLEVPDGFDVQQVIAAQRRARALDTGQPTAVVYRTVKGWQYGIEGKASHGAGHKLCSDGFLKVLKPLTDRVGLPLVTCDRAAGRPPCETDPSVGEACFWDALGMVRETLEKDRALCDALAGRLTRSRERLDAARRRPREGAPRIEAVHAIAAAGPAIPAELRLAPGSSTTLRGELARVLAIYGRGGGGAVLGAAADLLGSTSVAGINEGFPAGFLQAARNPGSRLLSAGGICEDAMAGVLSGVAAFGAHLPVGSSYGAFLAPLGHVAARLHAIGEQARRSLTPGVPYRPLVLVQAHAGLKTGEDGPTHADPQALQLLQENFAPGTAITLTPWDPQEIWPAFTTALAARPAAIFPFVTRPPETVLDRAALGLAPAEHAAQGVYVLCGEGRDGTLVLQGSAVTYAFVQHALPRLREDGIDLRVYHVTSAELFDLRPAAERAGTLPEWRMREAMGISDFTLPTLYRWVTSERGRAASLFPLRRGHYLGSGPGERVLEEAGLDGESQYRAIVRYVRER